MLDWIDPDSWEAFRAMRRAIKAPLTPYAEKLIMRELVKLKSAGHDPQACLDQSIMLGWRDVFPPRDKKLSSQQTESTADYVARMQREAQLERAHVGKPAPDVAQRLKALAGSSVRRVG